MEDKLAEVQYAFGYLLGYLELVTSRDVAKEARKLALDYGKSERAKEKKELLKRV